MLDAVVNGWIIFHKYVETKKDKEGREDFKKSDLFSKNILLAFRENGDQ